MSARAGTIAGLVLAGGASARMGTDKALILWRGRTLLDHSKAALETAGAAAVFIAGRPEMPGGLADDEPEAGPARAILSAAKTLAAQGWTRLLVVPVDMPGLTGPLLAALAREPERAYAYKDTALPLYLPLAALNDRACGARSVKALLDACGAQRLARPESPAVLFNVNTPEDLAQFERLGPHGPQENGSRSRP